MNRPESWIELKAFLLIVDENPPVAQGVVLVPTGQIIAWVAGVSSGTLTSYVNEQDMLNHHPGARILWASHASQVMNLERERERDR